jgi:hypothetical protein
MESPGAGRRPPLGFSLVSWDTGVNSQPGPWLKALEDIAALGVRRVTIVCYRFLQPASGAITDRSTMGLAAGPGLSLVSAVAERARARGFDVTLNPFLEIDHPAGIGKVWRGSVTSNSQFITNFCSAYAKYILEVATVARRTRASRLYVGSELSGLTRDRELTHFWRQLIADARKALGLQTRCRLGYAANHDEFDKVPFWDGLDEIGVDAYFPLVSPWQAKGPSRPHGNVLVRGFDRNLKMLKRFASRQRRPLAISEWGTVPFATTSVRPWHWQPSQTPDPDEQSRAYKALLQAIRTEGAWLSSCDLWHWRMPGNEGSTYGIDQTSELADHIRRYATMGASIG